MSMRVVHMSVWGRREDGRQVCGASAPTPSRVPREMWGGHCADPALCSELECGNMPGAGRVAQGGCVSPGLGLAWQEPVWE